MNRDRLATMRTRLLSSSLRTLVHLPWRRGLFCLGFLVFLWCGLVHSTPIASGSPGLQEQGAGGRVAVPASAAEATDLCNPFDPGCYANAVGQDLAKQILSALQPVGDFFQNSSANILTQTPAADSYGNTMIMTLNRTFVDVVDAALACLLLIGGYNVIFGHHLKMRQSSVTELIPRAVLVVAVAHVNLTFLGLFIDLNNALCATVLSTAGTQNLTNLIGSFLSIDPLAGLMLVVLVIVFLVMALLLLFQMTVRIALLAVLLVLAPLGFACFALPQTARWGRLWLTTFSSTVIVQFLQVTALGLGGMFITMVGDTFLGHVGKEIGTALLAIGMMTLVLKIPGMLQTWALHPMMDASADPGSMTSGGADLAMGSQGEASALGSGSGGGSTMAASSMTADLSSTASAAAVLI